MKAKTLYVLNYHTTHFHFHAIGETESEVREAMRKGWSKHCKQYPDADPSYFDPADCDVREVSVGHSYRDGQRLT